MPPTQIYAPTQTYSSPPIYSSPQKLWAEFIGTAFLLMTVIGSGIMAETLSSGNIAIALLGNTIPTGAILIVLITMLGPISGAHFNPAVTLGFRLNGEIKTPLALLYIAAQIIGAVLGVWAAHAMFGTDILQVSQKIRAGQSQLFSELIATFGLMWVIFATLKTKPDAVPMAVGLYITAAYWFTASTSFANPAVTFARSFSDSFAGIRPFDAPGFIAVQFIGAGLAFMVYRLSLLPSAQTIKEQDTQEEPRSPAAVKAP